MFELVSQWLARENSLRAATKLLAVTLTLSNILGVIRDRFLAQKIPTDLLDTYYAAFRLPDLVFNILILGAIASAFIPVFTGLVSRKQTKEALHVANAVISIAMAVMLVVLVVLYLFLPVFIPWLVPEFSADKQGVTLQLARLFLVSPLFFGLSYFLGGILNSYKRFLVYSLAPLVYNFSIIAGTVLFADRFGVWAPAVGVVVGSLFHMVIQLPSALQLGFRPRVAFDFANPAVRQIGTLMIPRSIGLAAQQLVLLGFTSIGSGLGAGAIAIYNLADNIQTMPTAVFGNSIASAVFPHLSESASLKARHQFARYFERAVVSVLFFLVPASFGLYLLRAQIVRLLLGTGFFGWEQTIQTARTLGYFSFALVFAGTLPLLARSFYAWQDTKTPTVVGIGASFLTLVSGFIFSQELGVSGLALGFALGSLVNAGLLYTILKTRIPEIKQANILAPFLKMLAASVVMAGVLQLVKQFFGTIYDLDRFVEVFIQAAAAIIVSVGLYLGLMKLFGLPQLARFFNGSRSNFR